MRKAARARDVLLRDSDRRPHRPRRQGGRALHERRRCRWATAAQSPEEFARAQSASTGLPERMCRANMKKNAFVLAEMRRILDSLTRGLVARRALDRTRRRARRADQLSGAEPGRRPRAALELARASTRCGCRSSRCRSGSSSSPGRRSRGRRTGWPRRSSRPASRARRSRSTPAAATSARRCSTAAAAT